MNKPMPEPRRSGSCRPDLGETYPLGHPSGRVWQPPVSLEQARVRVLYQMGAAEESCRVGLDGGYAMLIFDEAVDDYRTMVAALLWARTRLRQRESAARSAAIRSAPATRWAFATTGASLSAGVPAVARNSGRDG